MNAEAPEKQKTVSQLRKQFDKYCRLLRNHKKLRGDASQLDILFHPKKYKSIFYDCLKNATLLNEDGSEENRAKLLEKELNDAIKFRMNMCLII